MDYKQKYKEALERANKYYNANTNKGYREIFEDIFHEFKEFEDERIRKALIERFKWELKGAEEQDAAGCSRQKDIEMFKQGIAWLEKQKAVDILDEEEREFADNVDSYRKEVDAAYQNGYNEGVRATLEKQGEQKPSWSEEDEKFYISALWHIKNSCGNGGKDSREYEVYNWLKSIKPNHWKPSEEQMKALETTIHISNFGLDIDRLRMLESLYNDLKKL